MIRSTIPPISIKDTTISHIKPLKRKKHTTYGTDTKIWYV
jgi:hypothetical protein